MSTILDTIIARKQIEVAEAKQRVTVEELEQSVYFRRNPVSLADRILAMDGHAIIAEFKRKSPSKGWIHADAHADAITQGYASAGAAGISVLTDRDFFGANDTDFGQARAVPVPLLRKEFIIDEYQLIEARAMGADVILLIAACLSPERTQELARFARSLQLEVLLELHSETELTHLNPFISLVGINNRNLKDFSVSLEHSVTLASKLPREIPRIGESGIRSSSDIFMLRDAGFSGFLIGELLMREPDPAIALAALIEQLKHRHHAD